MHIVISGASGLLGSTLVPALRQNGHSVLRLVRHPVRDADEIEWEPASGRLDPAALGGVDAVINLSGAPVAGHRWSPQHKQLVRTSRVEPTRTLALAVAAAEPRPRLLLSASAIGWYGETGETPVDERTPSGEGYFPSVVRAWEAATAPAEQAGARVLHLRTGLVLTARGGLLGSGVALPGGIKLPLLTIFRLGGGGKLGNGRQWQSWISLDDEVGAMLFLLEHAEDLQLSGPVNLTAPNPVRNTELTKGLGRALHRPTVLPVPRLALRAAVGAFADEALASQRVLPQVLTEAGYPFRHPTLAAGVEAALADNGRA